MVPATKRIQRQTRSLSARSGSPLWVGLLILWLIVGCRPLQINSVAERLAPSNQRDWSPQFAQLPYAVGKPDGQIELFNIRNNLYLTENDFVPQYYNRVFHLSEVRGVDFVVCPFQGHEYMAHTMVSFRLADDTYIGVSAEIRTEMGESYSPITGAARQFEITYVVADERDIIRLRTRHRRADVYVYPTIATPEQSQALFVDMLERANQLARQPEFYHTVANNCTTNLLDHVNRIKPGRLFYNWKVFLPGYSAQYAYEEGLLDPGIPFEQHKREAWVNDLAERYIDDPDFSIKIRQRSRRYADPAGIAATAVNAPSPETAETAPKFRTAVVRSIRRVWSAVHWWWLPIHLDRATSGI